MPFDSKRRRLLSALPALAAGLGLPNRASAQSRHENARVVCGYPPGGSVDLVSRRFADRLAGRYARTCIVENRPGAAGRVAVAELRKAPPDGTTLLVTPSSVLTMYPHVYRELGYDPFTDLTPVGIVAVTEFALGVGPAVPAEVRTLADFVTWARANPQAATCGNAGAGSMQHFLGVLCVNEIGAPLTHVPFKGGSAALQAVAAGHVACGLSTENASRPMEQAGRVRVLATTGAKRSLLYPQAPTFAEAGHPRLTQNEWFGAFLPASATTGTTASLNGAIRAIVEEADSRDLWRKLGLAPETSTPAEARAALRRDHDFWGPIIKQSGFTQDA